MFASPGFSLQIPAASVDVPDVSGDVSVAAADVSLPGVSGEASLPSVGGDLSTPTVSLDGRACTNVLTGATVGTCYGLGPRQKYTQFFGTAYLLEKTTREYF